MSQYQRKTSKGFRWWYKFSYDRVTYHSKAIYLSKNEAKRAELKRYEELELQARNPSVKPNLSLLEAINERLDYIEVKKSKKYYDDNKRYFSIFLDKFDDIPVDTIEKSRITSLLLDTSKDLQKRGKDNYKVNAMLRCYKALFNFTIDNHELDIKNPCLKVDLFSIEHKLKYIPPDREIEAVLNICDQGQQQLLEFVKETACRISEALNVYGRDIEEGTVVLYTRKSRNSDLVPRRVALSMKFEVKPDERVFARWNEYPKFLEKKVKTLGFKEWSWHNLRHRRASLWSKEGKPIFEIMSLLGHSNMTTTQKYLQLL
jgi:integrase